MRYVIGLLIAFFSFVGVSAAQGHASHGGRGNVVQSHSQSNTQNHAQFHPEGHGNTSRAERRDYFRGDGGRHTSDRDRYHYDGRHFDANYHERFFGDGHRFWVGRRVFFNGGYRFWYGGFWFSYYDAWPGDWCYCDQVYIDYDEDTDCYFMYNPYHPGMRIRIGVVF
jgi:hypothetical protein